MMKSVIVLLAIVAMVHADVYMHNPRGSNNRLNENSQNRANANRLFDSQNNDRGGYNVGDTNAAAAGDSLGRLSYYKTSVLRVEWTNQHGAGNENLDTEVVLQYTCSDMETSLWKMDEPSSVLRDGTSTDRVTTTDDDADRGRHEPLAYYTDCNTRVRNNGLFRAGQNIDVASTATQTRQDPDGDRQGFECAEERDYYPYWHPTPWKDAAILTTNISRCDMYVAESQNVQVKGHCAGAPSRNNRIDCNDDAAGTWTEEPAWDIAPPVCEEVAWSRDNHLGNSIGGEPLNFNWTIPDDISDGARCVFRIRYNVSSGDYDGWNTYYELDEDEKEVTHISNDPNINILKGSGRAAGVQLNVNTAQFGRTFEDRSHIFEVRDRPADLPPPDVATIYNLNVRGRRGNIVEVFPAVEYDFIPRELTMRTQDYVHIAWTGSLSTPDGAGQGTASTDKSNIVCIAKPGDIVPLNFDDEACNLFGTFAQHEAFATVGVGGANIDLLLNDAPATFDGGLVQPGALTPNAGAVVGEYHYMCTRNNHFSNRAQRGTITVTV